MFHPFNYVLCGNVIITERWALGSFYLIFEFTPLYGLYPNSEILASKVEGFWAEIGKKERKCPNIEIWRQKRRVFGRGWIKKRPNTQNEKMTPKEKEFWTRGDLIW